MKTLFSVLAVGLVAVANGRPDDKDQGRPMGTYTFVKHNVDGTPAPEDELKVMTITFEQDKYVIKKGDQVIQSGTQRLDPSKKPAEVDIKITEGDEKGQSRVGIYEMSGDDLKYCFAKEGTARPKEFKTGTGLLYGELKKKK